MDQYLKVENAVSRLVKEYEEHGSLVVAYDFDNTVYDYHQAGHTYADVIALLKDMKTIGCYLIIFTANEDYDFIKKYCSENEIPYDTINENPPFFDSPARKIYYNILLDDRAGLKQAYDSLKELLKRLKK